MTSISLERRVQIETPEQTILSYTLAGVGSRAGAALVDLFIIRGGGVWALPAHPADRERGLLAHRECTTDVGRVGGRGRQASVGFAMMWGYYVIFEAIWDGQTPGKRWLDIRVVQDGGYSVSFAASAVRNLVRFLDLQPGLLYAVGLVSMTVSKSGKRLGDIAAGTIVVHEQRALIAAAVRERAGGDDCAGDHVATHRGGVCASRTVHRAPITARQRHAVCVHASTRHTI